MKTRLLAVLCCLIAAPLTAGEKAALKPDAAAAKMLADARANRAIWADFPGFQAEIEVNLNGKVERGEVQVEAGGKVTFKGLNGDAEKWAKPVLSSIIGHRLDSGSSDGPCAFVDKDESHPLGRAIHVLGDDLGSSFRVRDKQVLVVDRRTKGSRFTISVQENHFNAEGKYLPASYVVNFWSLTTGELTRTEAHHQSWKRLGRYDLPTSARMVTAARLTVKAHDVAGALLASPVTHSLTLSNHKLLK